MNFEVTASKNVYQGRAVNLWLERVTYPDGREISFEVIRHPGAVTILPVDDEGQVWFVRQYRHPVGGMLLELPAGTLERGEAPERTAAREIREEIGMAAGELTRLGSFYMAPGYSDEYMHVYLATQLTPAPLAQDEGEYIELEKYPLDKVYEMLAESTILDGKTIAAFALAKRHLERVGLL